MATAESNIPLLRTELYRPPALADYVHRSRMLSHLERGAIGP
jgi:ATP/maltotriose-dependent transcriptional regulator MalT